LRRTLSYLRDLKQRHPATRVVDIGGACCPWSADVADAFVDLFPIEGQKVLIGDINQQQVWDEIQHGKFDFCICSHTLEDIRDPIFVLSQMQKLFRHGYIAVPTKHAEFSNIESAIWVGYGHHRWIYTLADSELRMIAKLPLACFFKPRRRLLARISSSAPFRAVNRLWTRNRRVGLSDVGYLPWWRSDRAGRGDELAFIWTGALQYRPINNDYPGDSIYDLARLYRDELAQGL
jgi:hypothetical protein